MTRRAALLATWAALLGAAPAGAAVQGPDRGREVMLVANAEDGTVSIVDARSAKVLRVLDVVPDGREPSPAAGDPPARPVDNALITTVGGTNVAQDQDLAPDGATLYVSRGHRGDVAAIDVATGALRWKVAVPGLRADHMTISKDGRRLYVSALTADVVVAIDTAARRIVGQVGTGQWPHDNHLSHDGRRLYNSSIGTIVAPEEVRGQLPRPPYQLTVIDTATLTVLQRFEFDRGIRPTAFTHDDATMFAQRSMESSIMEVRVADGTIVRRVELPVKPGTTEDDYDFEAPHHGLALSGDERTLCAAGRVSDYVALVATGPLQPRAIIPVDDAPGWAATSPDGRRCFVPNTRAGTLSVIDYGAAREVARVRVGAGPKHIEAARIPERILCTSTTVPGCSRAIRLTRRCIRGRLRVALAGDVDAVTRVTFTAGGRRIATDSAAPYARTVRRARGRRLVARVEISGESLVLRRTLPRC